MKKVSICHAEKGSCNLNVQIQNHDRTFVLGLGSAFPPFHQCYSIVED